MPVPQAAHPVPSVLGHHGGRPAKNVNRDSTIRSWRIGNS